MESMEGVISSKELLEAQSHSWNHTLSFVNSMSLKCAIELGIPDAIHKHGKPITLFDLATSLSIPPSKISCFHRLMRLLVHSGIFSSENKAKEDLFSLTTVSKILVRKGNTACVSPFVLLMLDQIMLSPWQFLSAWFANEEPPTAFEVAHKISLWNATGEVGEFNRMVNEGMASDAGFTTGIIVEDCREVFRGLTSLVDVGGGTGTMARAIAEAFPDVECIVFDLPHVVADLEESRNLRVVGGDMFENIPSADAALFKWVLHDWSDEECVMILKRCKEAVPCKADGGKVIIIEMVMKTDSTVQHQLAETQLLFDIHVMAHTTGKQRYEHQWKKIFFDAGFKGYKIISPLGLRSVIEVYH